MRRRPPRSTPFPYTTLFRSSKRRTQASDCAAAEPGQGGEGAARRWTASRVPATGGVSPIGQNKWKAQEGTRPRQPRRSRQLARHRDRKFQLYRDRGREHPRCRIEERFMREYTSIRAYFWRTALRPRAYRRIFSRSESKPTALPAPGLAKTARSCAAARPHVARARPNTMANVIRRAGTGSSVPVGVAKSGFVEELGHLTLGNRRRDGMDLLV